MAEAMERNDAPVPAGREARAAAAAAVGRRSERSLLLLFAATTFLSAFLLFAVQPMFAKMVLPVLGGSPSVWAVAICFFQAALLAGYCYAHVLIRSVAREWTGFVHLAFCSLALPLLPISVPAGWSEPPPGEPYFWQLGLFTVAVGLPFMAVAANAPLLQAWFAKTEHRHAKDPYFLYAASNLGSLLALIAYPFVLEPGFGLRRLSSLWAVGFIGLVAAIAACFAAGHWLPAAGDTADSLPGAAETSDASAPAWRDRLAWIGLAFVPAALLTAFTTHVSTDIASAPLIWVVPLSLYLLTFVVVFRDRALLPRRLLLVLHLATVIAALLQIAQTKHESWFVSSTAGVAVFFVSGLVAHRTLYEARPAARHLTEFYLLMSLGGVLGGLFAALIAPRIFSEVYEYPLLLALTMACRPGAFRIQGLRDWLWLWLIVSCGALVLVWVPRAAFHFGWTFYDWGTTAAITALFAALMLAFWMSPPRQLALALLMFATVVTLPSGVRRGEAQRSYFGVYRVSLSDDSDFNVLTHGTTLHGAQRIRDEEGNLVADTTPATYYYPQSPMAYAIGIVRSNLAQHGEKGRYGVVGLGAGSLSCYAQADEHWRIFEIDPVIVDIATKSQWFTYIANCLPDPDIVLGDARLTIAKEPDASFDLIILDAFSSDAVPVHLMTAEALQLYARKIRDGGVFVLHISNRYLDLETVLGATIGQVPGLKGLIVSDDAADGTYAQNSSTIAVFAKREEPLEAFRALDGARDLEHRDLRAWTDDYSDILGPFLAQIRKR